MASASVVSYTLEKLNNSGIDDGGRVLTFTWLAADTGAVTATSISANHARILTGLSCVLGVTNPGGTAPSTDHDITIVDDQGIDIFGSALTNRSATVSEQAKPAMATMGGKRLITSGLTFTLINNIVDSANGVCKLFFTK